MKPIKRQKGYLLFEVAMAGVAAAGIIAGLAFYLKADSDSKVANLYGQWMAAYVNGVASFMAQQGTTAPAFASRTGTNWLKSTACGGPLPPDEALLSCSVPTNFNTPFGLAAPTVTFNFTGSPRADISFGIVRDGANQPDVTMAAMLSEEINRRLDYFGYQHVSAFHALPDSSDITSANLRAVVDNQIQGTVFLRLDGNSTMSAPVVSNSSTWALIARDQAGNENSAPQDPEASANVNDVYLRSSNAWLSETHTLAEEAYRLAARSPQFMTEVASNTTVPKPVCPAGLTPQIFTYPVIFVGGANTSNTRFVAGVRTPVENVNATTWRVRLFILYEQSAGWQEAPATMGRVSVTTRCS
ncbi:hypothetical protein [Marinobacter sp. MBR-105]